MAFESEFVPLPLEELRRQAAVMKADGWRFMQTHAVNTDNGVDLYYSFMKDGSVTNYRIEGVKPDVEVPSITDLFMAAFVFENEARELFGVNMTEIAIDFHGTMYAPAETSPMTFISPEQKAAKDKARKVAAAKAAKEAAQKDGAQSAGAPQTGKRVFVMTPELQARLDAKMPTLSPEKQAKVKAALEARAAEAAAGGAAPAPAADAKSEDLPKKAEAPQASSDKAPAPEAAIKQEDAELEKIIGAMDAQKAAKVRAAIEGHTDDPQGASAGAEQPAALFADEQVEQLLNMMDAGKAEKVLAALSDKEGE